MATRATLRPSPGQAYGTPNRCSCNTCPNADLDRRPGEQICDHWPCNIKMVTTRDNSIYRWRWTETDPLRDGMERLYRSRRA